MIDLNKERKWYKMAVKLAWIKMILGFVIFGAYMLVLSNSKLPTFDELENLDINLSSQVIDRNGEVFGKYYVENRQFVDYEELSPNIKDALLATEDIRYFKHSGIDATAIFRVGLKTVLLGDSSSGGGSTISQQLAKLLYKRQSTRGKSAIGRLVTLINTKFKEWITAVKLEKAYTKEEIMSMYLNQFEFINGAHGIQAAAEVYFNKDQGELEKPEAAMLVGMLKNPSYYNPARFPERTKERRNAVLSLMEKHDRLPQEVRDSLLEVDLGLQLNKKTQSDGPAPYFRAELTKWLRDLFEKDQYRKPDGTKYNVYTDGLKIYTTIDLNYQKLAEEAVKTHMDWLQSRYWRVWKGMNPLTFESDSLQKILRVESVNRRIHYSDRYKNIFERNFKELNKKVSSQFKFDLIEPALRLIFEEKNYENGVNRIENLNVRANYKSLLDSEIWPEVKTQWAEFQEEYKKEFSTKVPAVVFDYKEGEVEKEMTPYDSVMYHLKHLQVGMMAVEPRSGHVMAWVGGADHKYFKLDHVTTRRQVGSTIKPFVYATAVAIQGVSPCQEYDDIQYSISVNDPGFMVDKDWSPANSSGDFTGNKYNLYHGLLYSKNSITVKLLKDMGNVEVIRNILNHVGIDVNEMLSNDRELIPNSPSIVLGSVDLSVEEMCGAYTTFANDGVYTEPIFVSHIEDQTGRVVYTSSPEQGRALDPLSNAIIVDMLQNNTAGPYGLGVKSQTGGKTGTTNDYADGWFMGITPDLVVGTWVGGDEKWVRFTTIDDGQGFIMARPIFQKFIKSLEAEADSIGYNPNSQFTQPPPGFLSMIDCDKYKQVKPEEESLQRSENASQLDDLEEDFGAPEVDEDLEEDF